MTPKERAVEIQGPCSCGKGGGDLAGACMTCIAQGHINQAVEEELEEYCKATCMNCALGFRVTRTRWGWMHEYPGVDQTVAFCHANEIRLRAEYRRKRDA